MRWKVEKDLARIFALFPVVTVEGRLVWFRQCEMRILNDRYNDGYDRLRKISRIRQFRVLPVSDIWREAPPV